MPRPAKPIVLSIAIPTVNRSSMVRKAISSAIAQKSDQIEIIVSDNGSIDDTPTVISEFSDPRLVKYRHETTISATAHGNFLIDSARGEYFLGLSDDDWLEPDFVPRVLEFIAKHPCIRFLYTGCLIHYGDIPVRALTGPPIESGAEFISNFFAGRREVCWCSCVSRSEDLRTIGPIPEGRIFGDMFYWTKLAFLGQVGCIQESLSNYRFMNHDNLSSGVPVYDWALETRMLADELIARFETQHSAGFSLEYFQRDCQDFVARSTANQFTWNRIRGVRRERLLQDFFRVFGLLARSRRMTLRALAAIVIPEYFLRNLILMSARQRSKSRARFPRSDR